MSNLKCGIISPSAILIGFYHTCVLIDFRHDNRPVDVALEKIYQLSLRETFKVFYREDISVARKITIMVSKFIFII